MNKIEVPDWVARIADEAGEEFAKTHTMSMYASLADMQLDCVRHMLTAALGAWVVPALDEYQRLRDGVGGCTDGGCVIKRPTGMHTNGGCKCWQDKIKAQRMMRAGQKLFDTLRQEKPE